MQQKKTINVFVSYAWDSEMHQQNVLEFVAFLRMNGFNATFDRALSQNETATNFFRMMHENIQNPDKVIIVLSEGYKRKADSFQGGAGYEYELILADIRNQPNKYVLVSFVGIEDSIIPFSFRGRDIVDFSKKANQNILFSKLMGVPIIELPEVSSQLPMVEKVPIGEFKLDNKSKLEILNPKLIRGRSSSQAGIFHSLAFKVSIRVQNVSESTIAGLGFSIRFLKSLTSKRARLHRTVGDFAEISNDFNQKVYPDQSVEIAEFEIELNGHNIRKAMDSKVSVTIYSDLGSLTKEFSIFDGLKIKGALPNRGTVLLAPDQFGR